MNEYEELAKKRIGSYLRERWKLDALLGVGGMAAVYRATHRNGNRVAIKILHPDIALSQDVRDRFWKEGHRANAVAHPGAATILDEDVSANGEPFLVMELLDGKTLDALHEAANGRLSLEEVAKVAHATLDVLVAAHAHGIIHRDIKPENLFVTTKGQLKVLDFGIARMRDGISSKTSTGKLMGTPAYMSPEQAGGSTSEIDARTDLWAVAATMFTLLTGHFVHEAETARQLLIMAATRPARSILTVDPETPRSFASLIDRGLAFEKARRFADAREMQVAIELAHRETFGGALAGSVTRVSGGTSKDAPASASATMSPTICAPSSSSPPLGIAPTVDSLREPLLVLPETIDGTLPPTTDNVGPLPLRATEMAELAPAPRMESPRTPWEAKAASTTAGLSGSRATTGSAPLLSKPRSSRLATLVGGAAAMMLLGGIVVGGVIKLASSSSTAATGLVSDSAATAPLVADPISPAPAPTPPASPTAPATSAKPPPVPPQPSPAPNPHPGIPTPLSTPKPSCVGDARFYYPNPADPNFRLTKPECKNQPSP